MNAHDMDLDSRAVVIKANLNYDARRHKHKMDVKILNVYYQHLVTLAHLIAGGIQMMNIRQKHD